MGGLSCGFFIQPVLEHTKVSLPLGLEYLRLIAALIETLGGMEPAQGEVLVVKFHLDSWRPPSHTNKAASEGEKGGG